MTYLLLSVLVIISKKANVNTIAGNIIDKLISDISKFSRAQIVVK